MSIFGVSHPKFVRHYGYGAVSFTVNTSTDFITSGTTGIPFVAGDRVSFEADAGTLPGGLSGGTWYYIINPSGNTFQVSLTKGGSAVNITSSGTDPFTMSLEYTVNLNYAVVQQDEPDLQQLVHEAPLHGERVYVDRGEHWVFDVVLNLWKYSNVSSKFQEINFYRRKKVTLWRHSDGERMLDPDGNTADFIIEEVRPFYLNRNDYQDRLLLKFRSLQWVDLGDGSTPVMQLEDIAMRA